MVLRVLLNDARTGDINHSLTRIYDVTSRDRYGDITLSQIRIYLI